MQIRQEPKGPSEGRLALDNTAASTGWPLVHLDDSFLFGENCPFKTEYRLVVWRMCSLMPRAGFFVEATDKQKHRDFRTPCCRKSPPRRPIKPRLAASRPTGLGSPTRCWRNVIWRSIQGRTFPPRILTCDVSLQVTNTSRLRDCSMRLATGSSHRRGGCHADRLCAAGCVEESP